MLLIEMLPIVITDITGANYLIITCHHTITTVIHHNFIRNGNSIGKKVIVFQG